MAEELVPSRPGTASGRGAGNGPGFSSGAGHIMCIVALKGDKVVVADPNGGYFRTVTRQQWENAARNPQGNFLFLCKRIQ